jgi:hypothetical protein
MQFGAHTLIVWRANEPYQPLFELVNTLKTNSHPRPSAAKRLDHPIPFQQAKAYKLIIFIIFSGHGARCNYNFTTLISPRM